MNYVEPVIDWGSVRGVIFDMDGTLYRQLLVRFPMAIELAINVLTQKNGWRDLRIILHYRNQREKISDARLRNLRNIEFRTTADKFKITEEQVAEIIYEWMHIKPLSYIKISRFKDIENFISSLKAKGIKIGIFSDYPVERKLVALGLSADTMCCSSEHEVDCLKPAPIGLIKTMERMGVEREHCIMIGDRLERDGMCAKEAGVGFLLCNHAKFYTRLLKAM